MKRYTSIKAILFALAFILLFPLAMPAEAAAEPKQTVYDFAGLLDQDETIELETLANRYGAKRETDIVIVTADDMEGKDVVKYTEDFYDEQAPGYDQPHGNAVILTVDMENRELYLAGFGQAEFSLDNTRLDLIRDKITPNLSNADYYDAFHSYIATSYKYMGIRPGVNPNNILLNFWFQFIASVGIAGIVLGIMLSNSGGKVTVNASTYQDANNSGVLQKEDRFIRKTTTSHKRPKSSSSSGRGGGGGGVSGGGFSHSGSRGKF